MSTNSNKTYELVYDYLLDSLTGGCRCLVFLPGLDALLAGSTLFYRAPSSFTLSYSIILLCGFTVIRSQYINYEK